MRKHGPDDACFGSVKWNNIQLEEMINFFGMALKMSINDRRVGGNTEYFYDEIFTDLALLNKYQGIHIMGEGCYDTLCCVKKIPSAFPPKPHLATTGDKCHQLCYAINKMNDTAKLTFIPGIDLSFDDGGILSRSCLNPDRQYNKDKPNKNRVDLLCYQIAPKNYAFAKFIQYLSHIMQIL